MKFYNRKKEIEELRRIQLRAFESRSRMTVVTGRRRIGKTSLALRGNARRIPYCIFVCQQKKRSVIM